MARPVADELRPLTGLRGVAACYVVAYHYFQNIAGAGPRGQVLLHGYLAVDLFFVLSGFVMALNYGARFARGWNAGAWRDFLGRRIARIWPLYAVATLVMAAALATRGRGPSPFELLSNLAMVQSWNLGGSIDGPGWSISTEFAAYLLFPLLVAATLRGRRRVAVTVATCVAGLAGLAALPDGWLNQAFGGAVSRNGPLDLWGDYTPFLLLRCLAGFTLGLAAFRLLGHPEVRRAMAHPAAAALVLAAIAALLPVRGADVALVLLGVPLVMALAATARGPAALFALRPVYWLGEISYAIYLVHVIIDAALERPLRGLLQAHGVPHAYSVALALEVPLTLAVAMACYHAIEKPGRKAGRALLGRRLTAPTMAQAVGGPAET